MPIDACPEPFLNHVRMHSRGQGEGRPAVPEIVQAEPRQRSLRDLPVEHAGEALRVQRTAVGAAEDQAVVGEPGAHEQPFGEPALAVLAQCRHRARVERHGPPTLSYLR